MNKQNWLELTFKIIISIFTILMGAHEVQIHNGGDKAEASVMNTSVSSD